MDKKIFLDNALNRTDDWLKFAENKNALLLATNSGLFFGLLKLYTDEKTVVYLLPLGVIILSSIICSLSFIPKIKVSGFYSNNSKNEKDNLLYFGDISKYTPVEYLEMLSLEINQLNNYYANQIVVNSQIALTKFTLFNYAIKLSIFAIFIFILIFIKDLT